ncbi:hypothetical protein DRQ09_01150 [candidate division KSB1 bacterium]|nr:MAG: hypothetical protein DRQ09_01150 [candidate division KSB1 bacterium]
MKINHIIIFVLSIVVIFSCSRKDKPEPVDLRVPVTVERVRKGDIESYVTVTGTLKAIEEASIKAEVGGIIHFIRKDGKPVFIEGRTVKAGELLAELKNDEFSYGVRLESKKMAMEFARVELEKTRSLYKNGGATLRDLQNAEKNKVDTELNYKAALLELEKLKIKAPINGILADLKSIAEKDKIPAGMELGKVLNFKKVKCELNISNDDITKVKTGQKVKITNYSMKEETFYGYVSNISPNIDPVTRTYQVVVIIDNNSNILRPGMFIKADIIVESKKGVVVIPKFVISNRGNRDVVFVINNQRAEIREVETGLEDEENIEVKSGLSEGEMLVIRGYETLKDKMKVRISR